MSENNGTSTFALYAGNAQSGSLTTEYSGTLPTVNSGYIPMKLEGAIVLGTGGDNSNSGQGSFFEGAMTSGYPSAATESAVQANIVAAGYTGDSSGGSGSTDPAGTYTGPSDPGGSGPQDGFASPATEQPNDIMATKPALASFNGSLYVAFEGVNVDSNALYVASSTGYNFPQATPYGNLQSSSAPAMAAFNGQLFIAFRGVNVNNALYVTSSPTGNNFPTATGHGDILMGGAPALAEFNYQLCAAFKANDASNLLYVTCSSDGVTWPTATGIPNVSLGSDPAMASFNGKLYIAYRANDSSRNVWIASSSDGVNFSNQQLTGQTMGGSSSPALVVSNGTLYYIYGANDQGHEMLVSASTDGSTWQGPAAYLGVQMGTTGPAAAAFGNGVSVGFQSNDSRNVLFVTNKVTEAASYTGPSDPGGPGPQDGLASPATEQPNEIMATKPALASFQGKLYVAFEGVNTNSNALYIAAASTGINVPQATPYGNLQSSSAPAMAAYNNQLYVAFRGVNVNNDFYITSSPTGSNFPTATGFANIQMGGAPALATFNGYLCAAFQANDPGHTLHVTCSPDGVIWPTATQVPNVRLGSDPAIASFNGKLYIAYRADDPSNNVWIASSSDGVNFSNQMLGQTMGGNSSPALVVSNCTLYLIYGASDQGNEMMVMASADGSNWQGPKAYLGVQMGALGPGAAAFQHGVSVGFQSNDARNVLFVTNGADGTALPSGSSQSCQTGTLLGSSNPSNLPTPYPRLARLPNGNIVASANGIIYRSTDGGKTFNYLSTVPTVSGSYQISETGLWMVPQNAGTLKAGTLLYSGTYSIVPPPNQTLVIEIYISTDGGQTWHYLSTPVQGASPVNGTNAYNAVWEPEFEVDNSGNLVMFWSDETDPCCSQKIAQMDSSDGIFWGDQKNTVASNINADRPGMSVVSKLPNGHYFMSYEDCGPAACTVFTRTSPDGWDFGVPSTIANAAVTATGQYFTHTPANVWSPSPHDPYGEILLIGQVLLESNGQVSAQNGNTIFVSTVTSTGYGPWFTLAPPVQTPDAFPNPCPNWSSALLPSLDGTSVLELASDYNNVGVCEPYFATGATNF
jgi:frataxin-like iron-binding protein CyaY